MTATVYIAEQVPGPALVNHFSFDGVNDGLSMGTGANTNLALNTQSSLRIEAWVRFGSSKDDHVIAKAGNAGNGWGFAWTRDYLNDNSNAGRLFLRVDDASTTLAGTIWCAADLDDGEWHLLEVEWNGASGTILIDGVDQSATVTGTINAAFDASLTAKAVFGCDSGNSVIDNAGFGAFATGTDFGDFDVRWARFRTHNGTGWVTQMEFMFDEGTGTPASETTNGVVALIDTPAWTSDLAAPLALVGAQHSNHAALRWSRWWGFRETGLTAGQVRYEIQRASDAGFTTDVVSCTDANPSISETDLYIYMEEGQYLEFNGNPTGAYEPGETITGGTSGATGIVRYNDAGTPKRVYFHTRNGSGFVGGETITGSVSGVTGTLKASTSNAVRYGAIPPLGENANSATKNGSASNYGYGYEEHNDRDVAATNTYYYRVRAIQYSLTGTVVRTGEWSDAVSVAYDGARDPAGSIASGTYDYNPIPLSAASRVGILLSLGQTQADADDDVTLLGLSSNALAGPAAWRTDVNSWLTAVPNGFVFNSKPFGNSKGYVDDGVSTGTSGGLSTDTIPFPNARFGTVDAPDFNSRGAFATTSINQPEDLYERGHQLINGDGPDSYTDTTNGQAMLAFIDDWIAELSGIAAPTICYWRCPFDERTNADTDTLDAILGLALPLKTDMAIGMDTFSSGAKWDQSFGTENRLTAAGRFMEWFTLNYPGAEVWGEPGLFRERAQHWLDDPEYVGVYNTVNLVRDVFDETDNLDGTVTLSLDAIALDPLDYPDHKHIFLVSTSGSDYVAANAGTAEAQMAAIMEVARKIVAYAPNCYAVIGSHTFVLNNITDDQKAELIAMSDSDGTNYMRGRTLRTTRLVRTERTL